MSSKESNIYVIDLKNNYLLFDIETLDTKIYSKKEFSTHSYQYFYGKFTEKKVYIERCQPVISENLINPTIVTSFKCNYSCDYCYERNLKKNVDVLFPDDIQKIKIFYDIFCSETHLPLKFGNVTIIGGEPLLPENMSTLENIATMWSDCLLKITTNGSYLQEYMDYITQNNVCVKVSLGGTKETHFKKRRCGDNSVYEKTIKGIESLVKNNVPTMILTVFSPDDIDDYPLFFDLLEKMGWMKNSILKVGFVPEVGVGSDDMSIEQIINSLNAYHKLKSKDVRTKFVDARKLVPGSINLMEALVYAERGKYQPYRCSCLGMPNYAFFPDGTVHLCTAVSSNVGCVGRYKPKVEIDFEKIEMLKKRRIDTLTKCRKCSMKALCLGGCVATSLAKNNSILGTHCGFWKNPVFLEFLEEIF